MALFGDSKRSVEDIEREHNDVLEQLEKFKGNKSSFKYKELEKKRSELEKEYEDATAKPKPKAEKAETATGRIFPIAISALIAFVVPLIIGYLFGFMVVGLIIGALLANGVIILKFFPGSRKWFGIIGKWGLLIFIFIVIIWTVWFLMVTKTGKETAAQSAIAGREVSQAFAGLAPTFNMMKCMLTNAACDYSQLYTSEQYRDEYASIKNPGVFLEDVKPIMSEFPCTSSGCMITVIGRLSAQSISLKDKDKVSVSSLSADNGFTCKPARFSPSTKILSPFQCNKTVISTGQDPIAETTNINLVYAFKAKASKQLVVADENILQAIYSEGKDPLTFFNIDSRETESWRTEGPAHLGLGLATEKDIVPTNKRGDIEAVPNFLGISVQNNGAGTLAISNLNVSLSRELAVQDKNSQGLKSSSAENGLIEYEIPIEDSERTIEPGMFKTFFIKFFVFDDFLNGQTHSGIFALADLSYTYTETAPVNYIIKPF